MRRNVALGLLLAGSTGLAGWLVGTSAPRAVAQDPKSASGRYSVIETDILSLIVADNQTNTVYLYTVNQNDKPGSDLHLRGSLDLSQVGQEVLKPKKHKVD